MNRSLARWFALSLGALGVVYGDIGTSPIYAFRESFNHITLTPDNILGVLSLVFWSLILIVSIKYLVFILRADNEGEGGPLALLTLVKSYLHSNPVHRLLYVLGILGAALLFGDGMLTPAISVLSAVEGLAVAAPHLSDFVVPLTLIILIGLFASQHYGSARLGAMFGIIMLAWFITIAVLGALSIVKSPIVLAAINPWYAIDFFFHNGYFGYLVLGGVFLVITGGEALYADLGHFGIGPIRRVWFILVLPSLLLNYFGQGALLLRDSASIKNPFFMMAADWFLYPLIIISTLATVIASQAIISAVFSLTKQGILLQLLPRLRIVQTSATEKGQVYLPVMNFVLALGTISLVMIFQSSSNLAGAYGLAVNLDMFFVSLLIFFVFYHRWKWSLLKSLTFFVLFISSDLAFLGANMHKIFEGGWFPIAIGLMGTFIMVVWREGIFLLRKFNRHLKFSFSQLMKNIEESSVQRIPGTAVFVNEPYDERGTSLLHQLRLNQILHQTVVILTIIIEEKPVVTLKQRVELTVKENNFYFVKLHYGFTQHVDIPNTLRLCQQLGFLPFIADVDAIAYYLEIVRVVVNPKGHDMMKNWRKWLFALMYHGISQDIRFYHLPYNHTVTIGTYYEI